MARTATLIHDSYNSHDEEFARAVTRAKAEYLEMPGLTLTAQQATRLFALDAALCESVLTTLVESRFLVRTRNAAFARSE
jgi:hypothetical protein